MKYYTNFYELHELLNAAERSIRAIRKNSCNNTQTNISEAILLHSFKASLSSCFNSPLSLK